MIVSTITVSSSVFVTNINVILIMINYYYFEKFEFSVLELSLSCVLYVSYHHNDSMVVVHLLMQFDCVQAQEASCIWRAA